MSGNLDRDTDGPEYMDTVLVGCDDGDVGHEVGGRNIVDAVLGRAVAAHVVNDAACRHDQAVAALLDALEVIEHGIARGHRFTIAYGRDDAPSATKIRCPRDQRLGTASQDRCGKGVAITTRRSVRYGYVIGQDLPCAKPRQCRSLLCVNIDL